MIARRTDRVRRCLPLLWLLAAGCDDAHVVACIGDQDFCERVITANVPPDADAGEDQEAAGGDTVSLNGSGSADPDGRIASYSWTQLTGTAVALVGSGEAVATFTAPDVTAPEALTFRLTVVDDDGAAAADDVAVEVLPVTAVAARAGITLLSRSLAPDPVQVPARCTDVLPRPGGAAWFVQAGLWLAAVAAGLPDDADPDDVTRFLDAARVVLAHSEQHAPAPPVAASFWHDGLDALRRFVPDRDPALADWAAGQLASATDGSLPARLRRGEITVQLVHGEPRVIPVDPASATDTAVASLRRIGCRSGLDPIRLAADTVFLLERQVGARRAEGDLPARTAR